MADGKRVVLVKPGDVLLIGNAPQALDMDFAAVGMTFHQLGIEVVVFADDIDIDIDAYRAEAADGGGS